MFFPREGIVKKLSMYFGFLITTFYFIASCLSTLELYSFYSGYLLSGCYVFLSYLNIYFWKMKTLSQMFEELHEADKKIKIWIYHSFINNITLRNITSNFIWISHEKTCWTVDHSAGSDLVAASHLCSKIWLCCDEKASTLSLMLMPF